jgi:hypothetical protein
MKPSLRFKYSEKTTKIGENISLSFDVYSVKSKKVDF